MTMADVGWRADQADLARRPRPAISECLSQCGQLASKRGWIADPVQLVDQLQPDPLAHVFSIGVSQPLSAAMDQISVA